VEQNSRRGGETGDGICRSPLTPYEQRLLDLVAKEPDLTLEEIRERLCRARGSSLRHQLRLTLLRPPEITLKKIGPAQGPIPDQRRTLEAGRARCEGDSALRMASRFKDAGLLCWFKSGGIGS
jgi:hypothetical protein